MLTDALTQSDQGVMLLVLQPRWSNSRHKLNVHERRGEIWVITHIVVFSWKVGVTDDQVLNFHREVGRMAAQVSEIATIEHGPDLRYREGNADYVLIATFADRAAWDAYQNNPAHKAFVSEIVTPIMASRSAIQF